MLSAAQMKKPPSRRLVHFSRRPDKSALGKLFATPCLVQADFLSLDFARIAGYETGFAESGL
jgi:hypothetical protein